MSNVWAVTTRELRSYFLSPLAYLVAAFFVFGSGLLFWLILQSNREASLRGLIQNVHVLFLFVVPMISMRLLAEEQRLGTMELLMTNPIQEWEIVIGKFVASALTESQIVSAVVSFVVLLALWLSDNIGQAAGGLFGQIVGYTSLINHIQGFSQGVIDSKDVVFYLTVIGGGLVLSTL